MEGLRSALLWVGLEKCSERECGGQRGPIVKQCGTRVGRPLAEANQPSSPGFGATSIRRLVSRSRSTQRYVAVCCSFQHRAAPVPHRRRWPLFCKDKAISPYFAAAPGFCDKDQIQTKPPKLEKNVPGVLSPVLSIVA